MKTSKSIEEIKLATPLSDFNFETTIINNEIYCTAIHNNLSLHFARKHSSFIKSKNTLEDKITQLVKKICENIMIASRYGITSIDEKEQQNIKYIWDASIGEWFVLDENNNKIYE